MIEIIVAASLNNAIGKDNKLLMTLPSDLKRFSDITTGHTVVMGRKTWESLPDKVRPLPKRFNVVLTRNPDYQAAGADDVLQS
jgi:dihydrofolate reductase